MIQLDPEDYVWATWRPCAVLTRPAPAPFDFDACRKRLIRLRKSTYGWINWDNADIAPVVSRQEAHFWVLAMTEDAEKLTPAEIADKINEKAVNGQMSVAKALARIKGAKRFRPEMGLRALFNLFDGPAVVELMRDETLMGRHWEAATVALTEFTAHVFPYLAAAEVKRLKDELRPLIDPKDWPSDFYKRPPMAFFLAALVGMPDELLRVVQGIPDGMYAKSGWDHSYYHQTQRLVFGLGGPEVIEAEMRRLKLALHKPEFLRAWLALTQFAGLDYARDNILAETKKENCDALLKEFARVKAPDAAPHMLELKLGAKAPARARQWLDEQVGNAIAGLLPAAAGRGKLAEAAVEYLREAKKKGREAVIRAALKDAPADVAEAVRKTVLDHTEKEYAELEAAFTPADLKAALEAKAKTGTLPEWRTRRPSRRSS